MKKTILSFLTTLLFSLFLSSQATQTAPGGVTNGLSFWLKADAGIILNGTNVSDWQSQNSGNQVSENNSTRQPQFNSMGLNFNPVLFFDGMDDRLLTNSGYASHTQIIVFNPSNTVSNDLSVGIVLAHGITGASNSNAGIGVGDLNSAGNNFPQSNFFSSTDINPSTGGEYIAFLDDPSFSTDDPYLTSLRQNFNGQQPQFEEIILWGHEETPTIQNPSQYGVFNNEGFAIGQRFGDNFRVSYEGDVAEVISFNRRISDDQLSRIQSYLAIKYGLTLNQDTPQDYINSLGNTIYDANGTLSSFVSNITGIGRDDASGLNQKQSISTTTNSVQTNNIGLVTIGNGNIADTNILNTNNFTANQSFMLWGNNAENTAFDTPLTISSATFNRMQRTWAVQETGTVGTVTLSISQSLFNNNGDPTIIISTNPTFNGSNTALALADDGNGNYTATVNFENDTYFTFAQTNSQPPTLTVGNPISQNADDTSCNASVNIPDVTFTTNATLSFSLTGATTLASTNGQVGTRTFNVGTTIINYAVTDGVNTATDTLEVIIEDATLPVVICQNITIELDTNNNATITASDIDGGSTDNCSITTITASQTTFTEADLGEVSVILTGIDTSGNTNTCEAIVTVTANTLSSDSFNLENVSISPNPFNDIITIQLPLRFNNTNFDIIIIDINGRIVHRETPFSSNSKINVTNLNRLAEGPYFMRITSKEDRTTITEKLIKY